MKKIVIKFFSVMLCFACLVGMSINTYAADIDGMNKVEFLFADKTNGEFTGEITILFASVDNAVHYEFKYDKEKWSYGGDYGYGFKQYVVADKQYVIGMLFDGVNSETSGYVLVNEDGTPFTSYTATEKLKTFKLNICKTDNANSQSNTSSQSQTGTTSNTYAGNADDAEGNRLWNEFVAAAEAAKDTENFETLYKFYSYAGARFYEQTTNRPQDEYVNMTPYERMLWMSTYIKPALALTYEEYDYYRGSLENWNAHTVNVQQSIFDEWGTKEIANAYKALMEWQYNYFKENNTVYNFIEGKTAADYKVTTVTEEEAEQFAQDDLEQARKDLQNGLTEENETANKKSGAAVPVLIAAVVIGAAVCTVILYKKKQNKQ